MICSGKVLSTGQHHCKASAAVTCGSRSYPSCCMHSADQEAPGAQGEVALLAWAACDRSFASVHAQSNGGSSRTQAVHANAARAVRNSFPRAPGTGTPIAVTMKHALTPARN